MSTKINVNFEVRNAVIMKDTLQQLSIQYEETNPDVLLIRRAYNNTVIDANKGKITYDSDFTCEIDKIKQKYMVNWYRDQAIREGMNVEEEVKSNGEVVLHVNQMG